MKRELTLTCRDGKQLYARVFEAEQPKAVICVCHGLGEHGDRYREMAEYWNRQGYSVYIHDLRGHGRSVSNPKERGIATVESLTEDFLQLVELARRETNLPVFLFGHSLGGLIALYTVLHEKPEVRGAVVTSPWLILQMKVPKPLAFVVGELGKVIKSVSVANNIDPNMLCKDKAVCDFYGKDPLNHGNIGLALFGSSARAAEWVLAHSQELSLPLLLCHGDADPICSVTGSREFAAGAGCEFVEFPGEYHELHNEPTAKERLFDTEVAFMDQLL